MAIATLAAYKDALAVRPDQVDIVYPQFTTIAGRPYSGLLLSQPDGAFTAPSAAVVPTNASNGALRQQNPAAGQLSIVGAQFAGQSNGSVVLVDILSHQGGLSGTSAVEQTTNLPTAALTRYTDGIGVMLGLVIYAQIGATATTVSARYTNQSDVGSRATPLITFGGTNNREGQRVFFLPLQAGDTGVKSVQGVTITATTGTAGNIGVFLFKPLCVLSMNDPALNLPRASFLDGKFGPGIPKVEDNACIVPLFFSTTTTFSAYGRVQFAEN